MPVVSKLLTKVTVLSETKSDYEVACSDSLKGSSCFGLKQNSEPTDRHNLLELVN